MKRFQEIGPDTWLKTSSERYPVWKYGQAAFREAKKKGRPLMEPAFSNINYISV